MPGNQERSRERKRVDASQPVLIHGFLVSGFTLVDL
jgi:hypothetical protein